MLRISRPVLERFPRSAALGSGYFSRNISSSPSEANWKDIRSYKWFLPIQTRWKDNDQYAHVNNAVYQSYFDSVTNVYLTRYCGLTPSSSEDLNEEANYRAFIVECYAQFFEPINYPDVYMVGMSVSHLGNSSIRYRLGLFKFHKQNVDLPLDLIRGYYSSEVERKGIFAQMNPKALALGTFVHVVVDPRTQLPSSIPSRWRESLKVIVAS